MTTIKFRKYDKYSDTGIQWLGKIPEHWQIQPGFKLMHEAKEKNAGMKRHTILSLSYGKIRLREEKELTGLVPESYETYQLVNKGDIIFRPTDLQNDHTSLRSGISTFNGIITSAYLNLRFKPNTHNEFYNYFFRAIDNNKVIYGLGSGLRQNIDFRDFKRFNFVFPPLSEQIAIARFLDEKTARIDEAIAKKEKMIALLNERKQIIVQNAVTKGLDQHTKMKDSGVNWFGKVPEHWHVTSVKYVLAMPITDGPHTTPEILDEGIPFISAEAIKNGEIDFTKMRGYISLKNHLLFCQKYKAKSGDIYMVKSGATTGNIAMVKTDAEFSIWSPLAVFRANPNKIDTDYLFYFLSSGSFRAGVEIKWSFGTQQNIGMGILSNLPIAYPSIKEQQTIVRHIECSTVKINNGVFLQEKQIGKLKEYKAVLIDSAVTGKIKVI